MLVYQLKKHSKEAQDLLEKKDNEINNKSIYYLEKKIIEFSQLGFTEVVFEIVNSVDHRYVMLKKNLFSVEITTGDFVQNYFTKQGLTVKRLENTFSFSWSN